MHPPLPGEWPSVLTDPKMYSPHTLPEYQGSTKCKYKYERGEKYRAIIAYDVQ